MNKFINFGLGVGLGLVILTTACQPQLQSKADAPFMQTEKEFKAKVTELRMDKAKVLGQIQRLEGKRQESIDYLKSKGVKNLADVGEDIDLKYAVRNLKGWTDEIKTLQKDLGSYDAAIRSIETMLDELERKRIKESVAISEDSYIEMRQIVVDLNERLGMDKQDILADEELNNLLLNELADKPTPNPSGKRKDDK